jgi:hypothetical protein
MRKGAVLFHQVTGQTEVRNDVLDKMQEGLSSI